MQGFWLMCTAKYSKPRSVMSVMVGPSLPPCRDEGVPVHHDPVHGIVTNPGNENGRSAGRPIDISPQAQRPLSFFVVGDNPIHGNMVNWDPPISQVIDLLGGIQKGNASIDRYASERAQIIKYIVLLREHFPVLQRERKSIKELTTTLRQFYKLKV